MIDWSRALAYVFIAGAVLMLVAILSLATSDSASAAPTCSDIGFLEVDVHGQHVVRDYVIGEDGTGPGHEGAAIPGGPGPGFHFPNEVAPGASFCLTQSQSPGAHFGP